jgi:hypothetical protein
MNLTQFFDASIRLQEYGYKINFIDEEDKTYGVTFSYADVCSGLAFGGVQYEIQFYKSSNQSVILHRMVGRKLRMDVETIGEVPNIDEALDFIIADIQKIEEELKEQERQKVLAKLTQRERELLGV